MKLDDIPEDVQFVWALQYYGRAVGMDMWNKIDAIVQANPKYFPWETKYHSIPKEVHDAYYEEKYSEWDKSLNTKRNEGYPGLIPSLMTFGESQSETIASPQKSLMEIMTGLFKIEEDKRKREQERYEKEKALWDKHYLTFGLEFRKQKQLT